MSRDVLIGAISGNYGVNDIQTWVESSEFGFDRILIIYNSQDNPELYEYLKTKNIQPVLPTCDYWGNDKEWFEHHTGKITLQNSYDLIHNNRFLYINRILSEQQFDRALVTDVKDVRFNSNPFDNMDPDKLTATTEVIKYTDDAWNLQHLLYNLGVIGHEIKNEEVLNVGVFGGNADLVRDIAKDIYLLSVGKPKVADQTSFNYLVRTHYKDKTKVLGLEDKFAVHLQVIVNGLVDFNYNSIPEFSIVHQYDRIK